LFAKIWDAHLVRAETDETPAVLYVDLHLVHEVTSPQAFSVLRDRGLGVRRPQRTVATMDHSTPTTPRQPGTKLVIEDRECAAQRAALEANRAQLGTELHSLATEPHRIVPVSGPELC